MSIAKACTAITAWLIAGTNPGIKNNLKLRIMLTRFVLNQAWKHKGLALAGLAFYLYSQGKKKQTESTAPVHSSSAEEEETPMRKRHPQRRARRK